MTTIPTLPPPKLGPVAVDFYGIQEALAADLVALDSWNNFARSGTGQTVMRWIAAVGSNDQGAIARSLQELFTDTARAPSSILRIMRMLGVHVIRSRSGSITENVTRTDASASTLVIPPYTQWSVGSQSFFNRNAVILPATGAAVPVTLYRGTLTSVTLTSVGNGFQRLIVGERSTWDISDDDLFVVDSTGVAWSPIRTGLWREPSNSTTFFENTLPDGRVELKFGDGNYGGLLPAGDVTVTYAVLDSNADTQSSPGLGSSLAPKSFPVIGYVANTASPNQDPPNAAFYKFMGPGATANYQRAVTRDDHRAVALQYPGVVDARFLGQAETSPSDLRYMNVVRACLLTTTPWTSADWLKFKLYMEQERTIASTVLVRTDPVAVSLTIPVVVQAFPTADLQSLEAAVGSAVRSFFAVQAGSLGASYYPSDLIVSIMEQATFQLAPNESGELIDTVSVPMDPVILPPTSYFVVADVAVSISYTARNSNSASLSQVLGV